MSNGNVKTVLSLYDAWGRGHFAFGADLIVPEQAMSEEYVEIVRRGLEHFRKTGDFLDEDFAPEFVWDMSTFRGWPEQKTYAGVAGAREFIHTWADAWDEWELDVVGLHDAGDRVVAVMRQRGRAKSTGLAVDMTFAQVFTIEGGRETRMQMYADPAKAIEAAGLTDQEPGRRSWPPRHDRDETR